MSTSDLTDSVVRRTRSHHRWYIVGALVMAATLTAFTIALAAWPEPLAAVVVPGLLVVGAILAVLARLGRAVPAEATAWIGRTLWLSAGLMLVALLLIRLVLPPGISVWVGLAGLLPALPFLQLARRLNRTRRSTP